MSTYKYVCEKVSTGGDKTGEQEYIFLHVNEKRMKVGRQVRSYVCVDATQSCRIRPAEWRDMSAVFTASDICMGKPRGTTLVRMMMHLMISSCGVFSPSRRPRRNTYPAASNAKHVKMARATMISFESPVTLSRENSMTC